ncbi:zincin [Clavulina sp. PMI_390]|nr:zincin [Clavulina sp. PMI_390]
MQPRNALLRVAAIKQPPKFVRRTLLRRASAATAPLTQTSSHSARPSTSTSTSTSNSNSSSILDTNLRAIIDDPFSNPTSSSESLSPTGLFGNATLQTPSDYISLAHMTIRRAKAIVARITNAPNAGIDEMRLVVKNFDRLSDVLCGVIDMAELVRHAHPDPEWAEASHEAYEMLCSYMNVLNTHPALYEVLSLVMKDPSITSTFTPEEHAVALIFQRDFERSGIDLPPAQRSEFVSLSSEIITLGRKFLQDGPGPRGYIDIPIVKLRDSVGAGFSSSDANASGRRRAEDLLDVLNSRVSRLTGKVRIHGGSWEAHMLLKFCADADVRRDLYTLMYRSHPSNVENLEGLLRARNRLAQLVGSGSYAEMTLSDKMAKNPDHVNQFLLALSEHHRPLALAEVSRLASAFPSPPSTFATNQASTVQAWDRDYLATHSPAPTPSSLPRPSSLTLGTTFQALSDLFSSLFGLRFRVVSTAPGETWHPDVLKLEVFSEDHGGVIGWIFADLYARAGKQAGAAHYTVRCSRRLDWDDWSGDVAYDESSHAHEVPLNHESVVNMGTTMLPTPVRGKEGLRQLPISVLSCDFSSPTRSGGASRLSWLEVETLFHEMGHALHSMVGQTAYHNVAGTRCATDFVELPSILMEHFLASLTVQSLLYDQKSSTAHVTRHAKLSRANSAALDAHHQILLAMLDQAYHSPLASSPSFSSTSTLFDLHNAHAVIPPAPNTAWQMQFAHLYGYGATYYSYLFDQAIASRVFKKVFASDPLSRESGERYMREVLGYGGGKDPWLMVGRLLGDDEILAGDGKAMERVGRWGVDAYTSISQNHA